MFLRSVRVENFRAVTSAKISFDATTVLIGENDCGRSSVMEAVALALGWNAKEGEFGFQPFHIHRTANELQSAAPPIAIALEFSESNAGEWKSEGFEPLCRALPDVLTGDRHFWFEVIHTRTSDTATRWTFHSSAMMPLTNDRSMLDWLRRQMPVFWMAEGMMAGGAVDPLSRQFDDGGTETLAATVSQHYRDLLEGTVLDVLAAIEGGAAAARQLMIARMKLLPDGTTPFGEVLEEITGKRKSPRSSTSSELLQGYGTSAHKLGLLLLVGALLHSGVEQVEQGMSPLTLIENPEAHLHPMTLASIWSVIDRIQGQKIIATHSGTLLRCARLSSVRRLTRHDGFVTEWRVPEGTLTGDELRRYSYHLRSRRAAACFARCWLLVEGETEYWLMDELARVCGYELASEGVTCVEFAQCGLGPVIKVAQHLGIEWHLLADGDSAGQHYVRSAREIAGTAGTQDRVTLLREPDVEHCFWRNGYEDVFRRAAYPRSSSLAASVQRGAPARAVIARAIERHSKPHMAVLLLDAVMDRGPQGVPPPLKRAIETCIRLARHAHSRSRAAAT